MQVATESEFVPVPPPLGGRDIRADFPILDQTNATGHPLTFLDSASSSQKPSAVLETVESYYRRYNANIHRGVYDLSEQASHRFEAARDTVARFINAATARECVFVRNTTEGINLVAQTWGRRNVRAGDLIVGTALDHHANIVPWQMLAEEKEARMAHVRVMADGMLDMAHLDDLLALGPKVVVFSHVSNAIGTVNDASEIVRRAKAAGATVVVDAAQSAPHHALDVQTLGADFVAFSGHKMLAPMGSGVLWGRLDLLEAMPPFLGGGGAIRLVDLAGTTWAAVPAKFEAGTPAVGEAIGLGAAIDYLTAIGMGAVAAHEHRLGVLARERLAEIPGVRIHGPGCPTSQSGIVSFTIDGTTPGDVAGELNVRNVAVRAGKHCCHPLFAALGVEGVVRASFYLYNTEEDVDRLADAVVEAKRVLAGRALTAIDPSNPCGRPV